MIKSNKSSLQCYKRYDESPLYNMILTESAIIIKSMLLALKLEIRERFSKVLLSNKKPIQLLVFLVLYTARA